MSQIQQVKEATDIVEIIGQRVELKRAGTYFKGLCPFHAEKSPSFFVSEVMQRFKCFGCAKGGDVFEFLQQYENMSFYEALEFLADKAGIKLEHELRSKDDEQRRQLLTVLDLAREYYHFVLTKHKAGAVARQYLVDRQTTADSIKLFQLGYALPKWDGLIAYLHRKKKFSLELLVQAGLVIKAQGGRYYDRFRDRIMFPLRNPRGQVVGFSGRVLPSSADDQAKQEAKYINTPETLLYHKSKMLFGYSELHQQIRAKKEVVVVEGEFDVITSTQAHVDHIVAIKGSALTTDHALLLNRTVERVLLALDKDSAGVEATKRSLQVLKPYDLELRVIEIPDGKDPDDLARSQPKLWREVVGRSMSAYEFILQASLQAHDATSASGKRKIIQELAVDFWSIESQVEREFYLQRLAKLLQVQPEILKSDIKHFAEKKRLPDVQASASTQVEVVQPSRLGQLERYLTFLLFRGNLSDVGQRLAQLSQYPIELPVLFTLVQNQTALSQLKNFQQLVDSLAGDLQQQLMELFVDEKMGPILETASVEAEWQRTMAEFVQEANRAKRAELSRQFAELEASEKKSPEQEQKLAEILAELARL